MLLASDSETFLFQPGLAVPRPVCWSFKYRHEDNAFLLSADEGCDLLETHLDLGTRLIYHHAPFDLTVAAEYRPELLPKIFAAYQAGNISDTKTRQQLIDIRIGRRKNPVTKKKEVLRNGEWVPVDLTLAGSPDRPGTTGLIGLYFGKDRSSDKGPDAWRTRYGELAHLHPRDYPEKARTYAEDDAFDTDAVHLAQYLKAKEVGRLLTSDDPESLLVNEIEQCRASFVLKLVSAWGVRTDKATIDELEKRCLAKREQIRQKLLEFGIFRYKGPKKDPKRTISKHTEAIQQRVKAAFEEQGLPVPRTNPTAGMIAKGQVTGNIKTDKDTMVLSGDSYLLELADAGPAATVVQTFVPALRNGQDVPSNTYYDEMLDNGRISSARPNWNQLPRGDALQALIQMDVRQAVIPRPGFYFCSVDYDCAELRSHAQVGVWLHKMKPKRFPYPEMAKFFQDDPNGDPHLELAGSMLNLTTDEVKAKKKAGDKEVKHYRQSCKPTNFGLPGGMGERKLVESARKSYGVKMTLQEGRRMKQAWKARWKEMSAYLDYISEMSANGPWDVEQFVSKRVRGQCGYSDAANTYWSGLTADGAKHAMWNVAKECYVDHGTALFGSRIILFVYDEMILEVPIDIAHEAAQRQAEVMISSMREYLPDVPVTASPALMTRWIKGAEARYDASGRLIPWDIPQSA